MFPGIAFDCLALGEANLVYPFSEPFAAHGLPAFGRGGGVSLGTALRLNMGELLVKEPGAARAFCRFRRERSKLASCLSSLGLGRATTSFALCEMVSFLRCTTSPFKSCATQRMG